MHLTQIFFLANLAATRRAVQFGHFPIEEREARAILLTQVFGSSQAILHGYDVVPCPLQAQSGTSPQGELRAGLIFFLNLEGQRYALVQQPFGSRNDDLFMEKALKNRFRQEIANRQ